MIKHFILSGLCMIPAAAQQTTSCFSALSAHGSCFPCLQIMFGESVQAFIAQLHDGLRRTQRTLRPSLKGNQAATDIIQPAYLPSPASTPDYGGRHARSTSLDPSAFLGFCSPAAAAAAEGSRSTMGSPFKATYSCALFEDSPGDGEFG